MCVGPEPISGGLGVKVSSFLFLWPEKGICRHLKSCGLIADSEKFLPSGETGGGGVGENSVGSCSPKFR